MLAQAKKNENDTEHMLVFDLVAIIRLRQISEKTYLQACDHTVIAVDELAFNNAH